MHRCNAFLQHSRLPRRAEQKLSLGIKMPIPKTIMFQEQYNLCISPMTHAEELHRPLLKLMIYNVLTSILHPSNDFRRMQLRAFDNCSHCESCNISLSYATSPEYESHSAKPQPSVHTYTSQVALSFKVN